MSQSLILPVLPLDDEVVLPGMVVPLDLSETEVRAAIDAASASSGQSKPQVLLVPRIDGKYGAVGVAAVVEQVGRLPGGEPAAVLRGVERVRIGSGTTGPGAALWVEASPMEVVPADERAEEYCQASTRRWPPRCCRSAARGRSSTPSTRSTTPRSSPTAPATRRG